MQDDSSKLERITVIGAGTLGTQIAMISAQAGYSVSIFDSQKDAFDRNFQVLKGNVEGGGIKPFIPVELWDKLAASIVKHTQLERAAAEADLIIEAVPEDLEMKKQVFRQLGGLAPPEAILASNSSSIPVSKFEGASGRPEYCVNIHFYAPLHGPPMADLMPGTKTLSEAFDKSVSWVRSLGLVPLTVKKELLGFCFNRVWRAVKREVLYMWGNGFVDFKDIDRAWMLFNDTDVGPFGLMDRVGLDVIHDIEQVYYADSSDVKDCPPEALKEKIARGELGVKKGRGFYSYPDPEYTSPGFLDPSVE